MQFWGIDFSGELRCIVISALGLQLGMVGWSWCLLWGMMENLKGIEAALLWRLGERVSTSGNLTYNQGREPTWRGCCSQHTGYSERGPASCVCDLCSRTGPMFRRTPSLVYCATVRHLEILHYFWTREPGLGPWWPVAGPMWSFLNTSLPLLDKIIFRNNHGIEQILTMARRKMQTLKVFFYWTLYV